MRAVVGAIVTSLIGIGTLTSCSSSTASSGSCDSTLTYTGGMKSIIDTNCQSCHTSQSPNMGTLAEVQADKDEMYQQISDGKMPQGNSTFGSSPDGKSLLNYLSCSTLQ